MQPSPYTPGTIARLVPGRARQLADFDERLSYLVDLERLVGRIRVDHAPRGYGKTSLLREYERRARACGALAVWVTAGKGGLIEQIASEIARAIAGWADTARQRVRAHLDSLTVRLGVPGIAAVDATIRPERNSATPAGSREFEAVVRAASAGDEHRGLVILLDEVQAADADGLRTLAYAWQQLQSEGAHVPAAVYTAGLPNSPDIVAAAVTFSERFAYRPLLSLQKADEELALVVPARELGVEWDRDALSAAVEIARGYPYVVQLIGDAAWSAAGRPEPGGRITVPAIDAGRVLMEDNLDALFRARWASSPAGERRFMAAMADLGDRPVRRADIAKRLATSSERISVPRARLIDKGYIQPSDRGELEFTIPGFSQFVRGLDHE